jgi:hypothetical protein
MKNQSSIILFAFLFTLSLKYYSQICFSQGTTYTVGSGGRGITTADFNNDGKIDIATANSNTTTVSILLGNGVGGFTAGGNFLVGINPFGIAAADFNGDNNIDIVTANRYSNNVSVLLSNGLGGFVPVVNYTVSTDPTNITTGDFNNDTKTDVLVAHSNSNKVTILNGNGLGVFPTDTIYGVPGSLSFAITAGDFNADGKKDFVTANGGSNNMSVFLARPVAGYTFTANYSVGSVPCGIENTDLNNDGNLDLISSNFSTNNITVRLGNGSGTFGSSSSFSANVGPYGVTSADFNNDGKRDVAVANTWTNDLSILMGNGLGGFATTINFLVGVNTAALTCADFDGDGLTDIASISSNDPYVTVLLGKPLVPLTVSASASSTVICSGQPVTLSGGGANTYSWNNGVTNAVAFTPTASLTYIVVGTNTLTGCRNSATQSITVNPSPTIAVTPNLAFACPGSSSTFTASGATTYSWSTGVTSAFASFSPTISTTYSVTGTGGPFNCPKTETVSVTVPPITTLTLASTNTLLCSGQTATLNATGANSYTWSTGSTNQNTTVSPTVTTTYSVTGRDNFMCLVNSSFTQSVSLCTNLPFNLMQDRQITIFPNPCNNILSIRYENNNAPLTVNIYNVLGELIVCKSLLSFQTDIDLTDQNTGMYLINIMENNRTFSSMKFFKN